MSAKEAQVVMNFVRRLTLVSSACLSIKAWIWRREAKVFLCWRRYKHFLSIEFQGNSCSSSLIDKCQEFLSLSLLNCIIFGAIVSYVSSFCFFFLFFF